jgi:hypothetical protein
MALLGGGTAVDAGTIPEHQSIPRYIRPRAIRNLDTSSFISPAGRPRVESRRVRGQPGSCLGDAYQTE